MTKNNASLEDWKELYKQALMFKELAPWRWMDDSMVFGVQNPENGEIGYCCVMGSLGEVLGVAVYLGTEGLEVYEKLLSCKIGPEDEDVGHQQKCLIVTFDNREFLEKEDLEMIKKLGLKFRGKQSWPLFRNYSPGYKPWFLNASEVRHLTMVLAAVMGMAEKLRENPDYIKRQNNKGYLVLIEDKKGDVYSWREEWIEPFRTETKKHIAPANEVHLQKIKNKIKQHHGVWEVDFFYPPFTIDEGERPYFPYMALYVDHQSGIVINFFLAKFNEFTERFLENLMDLFENTGIIPASIMFKSDMVHDFLKPVADVLNIQLKKTKTLPYMEMAKKGFFNSMC